LSESTVAFTAILEIMAESRNVKVRSPLRLVEAYLTPTTMITRRIT